MPDIVLGLFILLYIFNRIFPSILGEKNVVEYAYVVT